MNPENEETKAAERWVGFRKELNVLDCTIRDGGLMNSSRFDDETVRAVYDACADAGIDYMEIGYKNSDKIFSRDEYGAWRFCKDDDIKRIIGDNKRDVKISVMADAEKSDYKSDIVSKENSPIDMVRIATYIHQIPLAMDMIKDATDKGYETTVNIMAVSTVRESELDESLELLSKTDVGTIYLVDSFGSFYANISAARTAAFAAPSTATEATGIPVGICTVDKSASIPPKAAEEQGTPITGKSVFAAMTPAR